MLGEGIYPDKIGKSRLPGCPIGILAVEGSFTGKDYSVMLKAVFSLKT
jgi:hypothetical protein